MTCDEEFCVHLDTLSSDHNTIDGSNVSEDRVEESIPLCNTKVLVPGRIQAVA